MRWEHLSWPEFEAASRDRVVIIPTAAIEQHSRHLPVWVDTAIANNLASLLDEACDNDLLVLPTYWLGCSEHHMGFPGSLTTSLDNWTNSVLDIINSVRRHGFHKVIVLNCHGGNHTILGVTLEKAKYTWPEMTVIGATYWNIAHDEMQAVRKSDFGGMGHACEMETSLMLLFHEDLVQMDKATKDGVMHPSRFARMEMMSGSLAIYQRTFKQLTNHGGMGDATIATKEHGQAFVDAIIPPLKELVGELASGKF